MTAPPRQLRELALVGFQAGYRGLTRETYQLDLRQQVQGAQNDASRFSERFEKPR
jgi:hypothetical protein